jgi:hypothetical protein
MGRYARREPRLRGWRLLIILVLLLPLGPSSARAQDAMPGVRNRIYESPSYGFTFVWDDEIWTPTEASTDDGFDQLALESETSNFWAQAAPASGSAQDCVTGAFNEILSRPGEHTILREPVVGQGNDWWHARIRTVTTDRAGNPADLTWGLSCRGWEGQPFQVLFSHLAWSEQFDDLDAYAYAIAESLSPPAPDWDQPKPPHEIQGILEMGQHSPNDADWWVSADPSLRFFTVDLTFENIDIYDARIDVSRLVLEGNAPLASYVWLLAGEDRSAPIVTIPADGEVTGRFTFVIPANDQPTWLCYREETGDACPWIALFGIGGSGSRPRIDPGR